MTSSYLSLFLLWKFDKALALYTKAAEIYERCLATIPEKLCGDGPAYNLATCYEKFGEKDKAVRVLEDALRLYSGCRRESAITERITELREEN